MHAGFSFSYSYISLLLRQPLSIKKSYAGAIQPYCIFERCLDSNPERCRNKQALYTVIRFVSTRTKFGSCTVVNVNWTLVIDKMRTFKGEGVPFPLTTVQVPNLALIETKRITVYQLFFSHPPPRPC
jgi:hypothetical protein